MTNAPIFNIARHRINTDGRGVVTLVTFGGCPLQCKYCINPECFQPRRFRQYTPHTLYQKVKIDELYFLATNGGVTFGGGEPLIRSQFISEFRTLTGVDWTISLETSLNAPIAHLERLLPIINHYYVDIKDTNPDIYTAYTGNDNKQIFRNLQLLVEAGLTERTTIRIPLIAGFNNEYHRQQSITKLQNMGFNNFDMLTYKIIK